MTRPRPAIIVLALFCLAVWACLIIIGLAAWPNG